MQDKSKIPVVFAIFERDGANVASEKLFMISNYHIELLRDGGKLGFKIIDGKRFYKVLISKTKENFELVEEFREKITVNIK